MRRTLAEHYTLSNFELAKGDKSSCSTVRPIATKTSLITPCLRRRRTPNDHYGFGAPGRTFVSALTWRDAKSR